MNKPIFNIDEMVVIPLARKTEEAFSSKQGPRAVISAASLGLQVSEMEQFYEDLHELEESRLIVVGVWWDIVYQEWAYELVSSLWAKDATYFHLRKWRNGESIPTIHVIEHAISKDPRNHGTD